MGKSSHSEVETFLTCERRHFYSYGMKLQSAVTSAALYRGICGHAAFDVFYNALKNNVPREDAVELALAAALAKGKEFNTFEAKKIDDELELLLLAYFQHWAGADEAIEVLATEYKIRVPISNGNVLTIVVDMISRQPGVGIVATDFKFTYDFFNPESVDLNPQLVKYMAALRMTNIPIARVEYDEIRTRITKENTLNNGKLFRRTAFKPTNARIMRTMQEHIRVADRIAEFKQLPIVEWGDRVNRVANKMTCQSCSYTDICINELNGWGAEQIILNEYNVREDSPQAVEVNPLSIETTATTEGELV